MIQFDHVSKIYQIGAPSGSLRGAISNLVGSLGKNGQKNDALHLAALNDVSFEIKRGESIGFIGPNGSGKTTTLKLISGVTRENRGKVTVRGKISALIELGAGFHPDLTGRENIYFNAAILGMRRKEIQQRFDAIVDFSGLERFLDTPVKRYSSGMYLRLGFAVAAFVNPDILLVDEVLAVGDKAFQTKCMRRMGELRSLGTTIVFVTHSLGYLQRLCQRAVFLYQGNIMSDGPVSDVIRVYRNHASYNAGGSDTVVAGITKDQVSKEEELSKTPSPINIIDTYFTNKENKKIIHVRTGESFNIHVHYKIDHPVDDVNFEIWFYGIDGVEYASFASGWDAISRVCIKNSGEAVLNIDHLGLMPGEYYVNVAISDQNGLSKYDIRWDSYLLKVLDGPISFGLIYQPHKWLIDGID